MSALAILKGADALLGVANGGGVGSVTSAAAKSPDQNLKDLGASLGQAINKVLKGGFKCLGNQAYRRGDLDEQLNRLNGVVDKYKGTYGGMVTLLNHLEREYVLAGGDIAAFRSNCSKQYKEQYKNACGELLGLINKSAFNVEHKADYDAFRKRSFSRDYYTLKEGVNANASFGDGNIVVPKPEPKKDEFSAEEALKYFNAVTGGGNDEDLNPRLYTPGYIAPEREIEELELVGTGKPVWNIGGSGRTADGVDWNIGAGKSEQDNTMKMVMMLGVGLLAYKVLFDKK